MSSLVQRNKVVAKRKGALVVVAGAGAVAAGVVIAPVAGIVAAAGAVYLGWDWLSFRIKNGMRF